MVEIKVDAVIQQLEAFRETHGEEEYRKAARGLAVQLVRTEAGSRTVETHFPFFDIEELKQEAAEKEARRTAQMPSDQAMIAALRERIPSLRTQAQYNLFSTVFETLTSYLDFAFQGDQEGAGRLRKGLDKLLDAAFSVTEIGNKLENDPNAAGSPEAAEFKEPPREFKEFDIQRRLMLELDSIQGLPALEEWYDRTRKDREKIISQSLRDELFDRIRGRKKLLQLKDPQE